MEMNKKFWWKFFLSFNFWYINVLLYMVEDQHMSIVMVNLLLTRSELVFFNLWKKLINNLTIYHMNLAVYSLENIFNEWSERVFVCVV